MILIYIIDLRMDMGVLCFWCTDVLPDVPTSYFENLFFSEVSYL